MANRPLALLVVAGESVVDCDVGDLALLCLQVVPADAAVLPV